MGRTARRTRVLVISHLFEPSVDVVVGHLSRMGVPWERLNCEQFPLMATGELRLHANGAVGTIRVDEREYRSDAFSSVWYRRVAKTPVVRGLSDSDKEFVRNEAAAFLTGFFDLINAQWTNDRAAERRATSKPHQLHLASQLGFRCPETLVTNDATAVRAFVEKVDGPVIFKPVAGYSPRGADFTKDFAQLPHVKARFDIDVPDEQRDEVEVVFSQLLSPEKLEQLDALALCPAIFQEYIEKRADIRVTVVGSRVFACEIHSQALSETKTDFRRMAVMPPEMYAALDHRNHKLDFDVESRVRELMSVLKLDFGCIDLVLTPAGEYVFLEVNPSGQWLWIEQRTGARISEALARFLSKRRTSG